MKAIYLTLIGLLYGQLQAQAFRSPQDSLSAPGVQQELKQADSLYTLGRIIDARDLYRKQPPEVLSPAAKVRLGSLLILNDATGLDIRMGARLLEEEYTAGNKAAAPYLGWLYYNGRGVAEDEAKGLSLIEIAIKEDLAAGYYYKGRVAQDKKTYTDAVANFEKAAAAGHAASLVALGALYESGLVGNADGLKAEACYQRSAKLGNGSACSRLGWLYYWGKNGVKQDYDKAFRSFNKAAVQGDVEHNEALGLGYCYNWGKGTAKQADSALYYYRLAGAWGRGRGYAQIGIMYRYGHLVPKQVDSAFFYLRKAADAKDAWACYHLSDLFSEGIQVARDEEAAMAWIKMGVSLGDEDCKVKLARYYKDGVGTPKNIEQCLAILKDPALANYPRALVLAGEIAAQEGNTNEALAYFKKAAEGGNDGAMLALSKAYQWQKNRREREKWLDAAITAGNAEAMYIKGVEYNAGNERKRDTVKGNQLILAAAERGHMPAIDVVGLMPQFFGASAKPLLERWKKAEAIQDVDYSADYNPKLSGLAASAFDGDASGQYLLGLKYLNGIGVEKNYKLAVQWFQQSAAQGFAESYYELGKMYYNGTGFQQSYADALTWYELAAEKGVADAINSIGVMYYSGTGLSMDRKKAATYYERAAAAGSVPGQSNLGYYYIYHLAPTQQNYKRGVALTIKAAEAGYPTAQCNLGMLYENGTGVPQDKAKAEAWYRKAWAQDELRALGMLIKMYWSRDIRHPEACTLLVSLYEKRKHLPTLVWLYDVCKRRDVLSDGEAAKLLDSLMTDRYKLGTRDKVALMEFWRLGIGTAPDIDKAIALGLEFEKAGKDVELEQELARLYGAQQPANYTEAFKWCSLVAASQGEIAVFGMGDYYADDDTHISDNDSLIYSYFKAEAEKGNINAMRFLGYHYKLGRGVPVDFARSIYWFEQAAAAKDTASMQLLCLAYSGKGIIKLADDEKMRYWLEQLAAAGNVNSFAELGDFYFNHKAYPDAARKCVYWYEKAAVLGHGVALNNLGECYYQGYGVPKNYEKARHYYEQAVENNCMWGKVSLSTLYLKGHGVPKDKNKARQLCQEACEANEPGACIELEKIN